MYRSGVAKNQVIPQILISHRLLEFPVILCDIKVNVPLFWFKHILFVYFSIEQHIKTNATCLNVIDLIYMMQSISQICKPTLNALLYGVTDLSDETNRQLFIIIQEYILRTKRFQ